MMMSSRLNRCLKASLPEAKLGFARHYSKYNQEHDYTVTPSTYVYTTEENKDLFERFPLITAKKHRNRTSRPIKTRLLAREFIEDSMYNPTYGYFSRSAEIFSPKQKFEVQKFKNVDQFIDKWALEYRNENKPKPVKVEKNALNTPVKHERRVSRQLWHTPSELFSPHYGEALARYMISQLKPGDDLVIYETGAGNGTLMSDILNYVEKTHPEVYKTMRYNIVEISSSLALKQKAAAHTNNKVKVHNKSIFDWSDLESSSCFFIALEVWDNLAHDIIRYDNSTGQPYQGYVVVDTNGDFTQVFSPKLDPLAKEFLEARKHIDFKPDFRLGWHPLNQPAAWRKLKNRIVPFKGNLSPPEYIPTRFFEMLKVLKTKFPNHRLIGSDFTHFTERIEGYQSPVVQSFIEETPVTVSTFMVLQGFFDIMFPTDFRLASQLYLEVMDREAKYIGHGEFLEGYVGSEVETKAGEKPILEFYKNAAFLLS